MSQEYSPWDIDLSLFEEMKDDDIRSYLISKYDIDTAKRIMILLWIYHEPNIRNNTKVNSNI